MMLERLQDMMKTLYGDNYLRELFKRFSCNTHKSEKEKEDLQLGNSIYMGLKLLLIEEISRHIYLYSEILNHQAISQHLDNIYKLMDSSRKMKELYQFANVHGLFSIETILKNREDKDIENSLSLFTYNYLSSIEGTPYYESYIIKMIDNVCETLLNKLIYE